MKTGYKVMDAMTTKPISVEPSSTVRNVAEIMSDFHVGAVVVKTNGISKGIITEQDIVRKIIAKGINPLDRKVEEFMEKQIHTIRPDEDIYDALIKMRDLNIRHLPVVEDGNMIGLLTLKDVLKIQPSLFDLIVEKFELREEKRKPINRVIPNEGICEECGEYSEDIKEFNGSLLCRKCV